MLPSASRLLTLSHLFVCATAAWGGAVLIGDPTGKKMGMSEQFLAKSPFADFLIPGLVLALLVGGSAGVAAAAQGFGWRWRAWASRVAGLMIGGWILVELAMVQMFSWLQVLYLCLGALQVGLAQRTVSNRTGLSGAPRGGDPWPRER